MQSAAVRIVAIGVAVATMAWIACSLGAQAVTDPAKLAAGGKLTLPAGEIKLADLNVPDGAVIEGAGVDKTIIDADGAETAFLLSGVKNVKISDLTIRNVTSAGVIVIDSSNVDIQRVRVTKAVVGVSASNSTNVSVVNALVDHADAGISFKKTSGVVGNCTFASIATACVSLTDSGNMLIANNIFADALMAVAFNGDCSKARSDYNLFSCFTAGRMEGQNGRIHLATWRTVSRTEKHSLVPGIDFASRENGDFTPTAMLSWLPSRNTVEGWGIGEWKADGLVFTAPKEDLFKRARLNTDAPTLGAIEVARLTREMPPADGTFEISADAGVKSAGVFTKDGVLIRYLFHDLPLRKGTYRFVLPGGRTELNEAIAAGEYEVRVAEADLDIDYRGFTGNLGAGSALIDANCGSLAYVAWASDGNLLLANGWQEKHMNVVKLDLATGKGLWAFKGSAANMGVVDDGQGTLWFVRGGQGGGGEGSDKFNTFDVVRIDSKTGHPILDDQLRSAFAFTGLSTSRATRGGVALVDGRLYIGDCESNQVIVIDTANLEPLPALKVDTLRALSGDTQRKLLWVVSGDKILALDTGGKAVHTFAPGGKPIGVAVNGDRLAVADAASGKVTVYSITDPAKPTVQNTIGTGDGPFGPWAPDRFTFQSVPDHEETTVQLTLRADGALAVKDFDYGHLTVFAPDGKVLHHAVAHFGNSPAMSRWTVPAKSNPAIPADAQVIFDSFGKISFWVDSETGKTGMDAYWKLPAGVTQMIGNFEKDGRRFGVFRWAKKIPDSRDKPGLMIVRYEGFEARPLLLFTLNAEGKWSVFRDANNSGKIDDTDSPCELFPFPGNPATRWLHCTAEGDIISNGGLQAGMVWKLTGLDDQGVPMYEVGPDLALKKISREVANPYDFEKKLDTGKIGQSETLPMPGNLGTAVCAVLDNRQSYQGMGFSNSGATDLARYGPDGTLLWFRTMNITATPIQGCKPLGDFLMTSYGHDAYWMFISNDGLGLGGFGPPAAMNWGGYWMDHPDHINAFMDKKGRIHIIAGDYSITGVHWLTVLGEKSIKQTKFPFVISAEFADALAQRPTEPAKPAPRGPNPSVLVKKLDAPMTMDGDLEKWRKAVPTPQAKITPATAHGNITTAADQSATVRMAWHGDTVYFQFLVFDDIIAQHQTVIEKFYLQDSVQMTINGFLEGYAFSVATLADGTELLYRNRYHDKSKALVVPGDVAPRKFIVLDDATAVTERRAFENIYGEDMSKCKVRVYEFALPINATLYGDDKTALKELKMDAGQASLESGLTFWIGFMLNDVDILGVDEQPFMVWPSTYGMYSDKNKGAVATLE